MNTTELLTIAGVLAVATYWLHEVLRSQRELALLRERVEPFVLAETDPDGRVLRCKRVLRSNIESWQYCTDTEHPTIGVCVHGDEHSYVLRSDDIEAFEAWIYEDNSNAK